MDKTVKILNVISQYPGKTGSGTYLESLIREGKKAGHDQALIAALPAGEKYSNHYIDRFYPVYFETESLPFPIVGMSDVMPYESTIYSDLNEESLKLWMQAFKATIIEAIEDFKPDIIISHHLWILTSMLTDLAKDIKIIGVCHGTDIRQLINNPQFKGLVTKNIKHLDHIISLSQIQKEEISKHYQIALENIKVLGGGFNQDIFYRGNNKASHKSIKLIYVGKLSYQKGIVSLIKVFKRIKKDYPLHLTIVGSGFGEEEAYIRDLAKDKDIKFTGELSQENLGDIYRQANIFILPSFYEGLSLVTLEALASGLLTVVSEIPALRDFLGQAINDSGLIEYVDLEDMRYKSLPQGRELELFEKDLQMKLIKQIDRFSKGYFHSKEVQREIEKKSWTNVYKEIEEIFSNVKKA